MGEFENSAMIYFVIHINYLGTLGKGQNHTLREGHELWVSLTLCMKTQP